MYRLIDRILGCLNDFLDWGMTAANDENNPVRCIDCQRDFLYFRSAPQVPFSRMRWTPGATSVVLVIQVKLASGHGLPKRSVSGGFPSKFRTSTGSDSLRL